VHRRRVSSPTRGRPSVQLYGFGYYFIKFNSHKVYNASQLKFSLGVAVGWWWGGGGGGGGVGGGGGGGVGGVSGSKFGSS